MKTGTPDSQQRPQSRRIAAHIPLALGGRCAPSLPVVVPPVDAPAHHHHPLELAKSSRIALDRRLHIGQRPDGDQRNLPRMRSNLIEQKLSRHRHASASQETLARISSLGKCIGCSCVWNAGRHRNIASPHRAQVPIHQPRPQLRIAVCRRDAQQLQLRAPQSQRQRKGIVNIVADIGIENHQLRLCRKLPCSRRSLPARPGNHHAQRCKRN